MKADPSLKQPENQTGNPVNSQTSSEQWRKMPGIVSGASDSKSSRNGSAGRVRQAVSVLTPIVILVLWEVAANLKIIDVRFFPAPSAIGSELISLFRSGTIWTDIGATLSRILWGFAWGTISAIIIGLLMWISPLIRAAI